MKIFITSARIQRVGQSFRIHRMSGQRTLFHTTRDTFRDAEIEAHQIAMKTPYLWKDV